MRIGGLASGMDIDSLVGDLMKAERMPLDKLEQKKQWLEWQRDDYRDMNKTLFDFDKQIFDGVMRQATYLQKKVDVSGTGVSVRNISSTSDLTGSMNVERLATSSQIIGGITGVTDSSAKLDTQGITGVQEITIKAPNKDGSATVDYTYSFDPAKESLDKVISHINANSGANVFFDSQTKQISVTAKNTGSGSIELIDGTGSSFFSNLKLEEGNGRISTTAGETAKFTYNGLTTTRASNTFQINGFEFTLKEADAGKNITFNSTADTDKIFDTILKFADKYNEVIEKINGELNEKQYRDYKPLTAEQKEAMEEKQIELWEERAKSGTLRRDPIFSSGLNKMRTDLYSPVAGVSGATDLLSEIGIKTSTNYMDRGKLIIDETKLKEAISKDPNAIYELFAKDGTTTEEKGLGRRLRDTIKDTMSGIEKKAGKITTLDNNFAIGRNIDNITKSMQRFEDRLVQVEDRYWRQFTAMEKAIQRSNEQSMFLMNSFGGGM